jgi:hypothetical protein
MYIAGYNMPGFMPDNEPREFVAIVEAFDDMLCNAENYLDELGSDWRIIGLHIYYTTEDNGETICAHCGKDWENI